MGILVCVCEGRWVCLRYMEIIEHLVKMKPQNGRGGGGVSIDAWKQTRQQECKFACNQVIHLCVPGMEPTNL
jgi:hypothetical protein